MLLETYKKNSELFNEHGLYSITETDLMFHLIIAVIIPGSKGCKCVQVMAEIQMK